MEQKVALFDVPHAQDNEQQLHDSGNDFLQQTLNNSNNYNKAGNMK